MILPSALSPQIFADLRASLILVEHHETVGADVGVDQFEMQLGYLFERRRPTGAQFALAAHRAAGVDARRRDVFRCRLAILGMERENARQIAGIPGRGPVPPQPGLMHGIVMRDFSWLAPGHNKSILLTYMDLSMPMEGCGPPVLRGCGAAARRVLPSHDTSTASRRVDAPGGLGA